MKYPIPCATYRLQFNHFFTFKQAAEIIPYLHHLGITDIYASPLFKAAPKSLHGYDVTDYSQLNPEIGTEEEFKEFVSILKQHQMGLIVDIVPNHMCVSHESNPWWQDILENGPNSYYSRFYDIDWNPPSELLKNKVLLPVLDDLYGKVLENQELQVEYENGGFLLTYMNRPFPLNPKSWLQILEPAAQELLQKKAEENSDVLELQSILTAITHLPKNTETDFEKIKERHRENEIIKKRLAGLVEGNGELLKILQDEIKKINGVKGNSQSFDRLEDLLQEQAYRLSFWRAASDEVNYRRFFDINEYAGLRVEYEEVFEPVHRLILRYIKEGCITGLRIDHVDGLYDPVQYLIDLQKQCAEAVGDTDLFYIIVEKILLGNEELRPWPVYGTTGYDFLNFINHFFVVRENGSLFRELYAKFTHQYLTLFDLSYTCKSFVLEVSMASELQGLSKVLTYIAKHHRWSRDYTWQRLRAALRDVMASFPVYRSYVRAGLNLLEDEDRKVIEKAIHSAKRLNPGIYSSIFDFIKGILLLNDPVSLSEDQLLTRQNFVMRFQQLTGPLMAKGIEDTDLYRCYPLASLNEVGFDLRTFGLSTQEFHQKNLSRLEKWSGTLLATSTHDTKRGEDVRARLNVLSEIPSEWEKVIWELREIANNFKSNEDDEEIPDRNEEYLIYQTLVGTWPFDYHIDDHYIHRIQEYMVKAMKEAKIHTSWINPNREYEENVKIFISDLLHHQEFIEKVSLFFSKIKEYGIYNSLVQLVLKITVPGIPDFYQGTELWNFSLVDPDNRKPIDYRGRPELLASLHPLKELLEKKEDGRIKLFLTSKLLQFRKQNRELFLKGSYIPLNIEGEISSHAVAFQRTFEGHSIIVAVGRHLTSLKNPIGESWKNTKIGEILDLYEDIFSGKQHQNELYLSEIFSEMPLTVLRKL